jgi:AraC family transcriptional regulator, regulatory protein of adaptative response / methylated-DNA-[protein]-cysteine methyltransferase
MGHGKVAVLNRVCLGAAGRVLDDNEWAAMVARAPGPGVYGVVTTGIVCRPGCPARTPLRGNVRWFDGLDQALGVGFRRCKRCGAE